MKVSAAEVLYNELGIISEKDYFKRSDYIAPSKIKFIKQYDSKEDFLKDYAYSNTSPYIIRGVCFNYNDVIHNRFTYQVGQDPEYGYCLYTEIEEEHKTTKISSVEYICMSYAVQVLEDHDGLLPILDDCAQKYGKTSEQVKQIWNGFLYKDNALNLRTYHRLIKEFCFDNNIDDRELISFSLSVVLHLVLNRNDEKISVMTKPVKCQLCEPINTIKQQEIIEKEKSKTESHNLFYAYVLPAIIPIIIGTIINLIAFWAYGFDYEEFMGSAVPMFMYPIYGCMGGIYILERAPNAYKSDVMVIFLGIIGIAVGVTPLFLEYMIFSFVD